MAPSKHRLHSFISYTRILSSVQAECKVGILLYPLTLYLPASHSAVRRTLAGRGEPRTPCGEVPRPMAPLHSLSGLEVIMSAQRNKKQNGSKGDQNMRKKTEQSLSAVTMTSMSGYTTRLNGTSCPSVTSFSGRLWIRKLS